MVQFNKSSPLPDFLMKDILRLPRELRDLIYAYVAPLEGPLHLSKITVSPEFGTDTVLKELLEAFYTHNTCAITHTNLALLQNDGVASPSIWGAYPEYKQHIRKLEVYALEAELKQTDISELEHECTVTRPELRREWAELLDLPRLECLTVNLHKQSATHFTWANFSPILFQLRETLPRVRITFNISFDIILEHAWHDDRWALPENGEPPEPYQNAGFINVSDLMHLPDDESEEPIEGQLVRMMEAAGQGRDVVRGLLSESVEGRRILAIHYVVKEPMLLRLLMQKHYEFYKTVAEEMSRR